jgi:two-component sensor histidine kinase
MQCSSSFEEAAVDFESSIRTYEDKNPQPLLNAELQHRIRNILTLVQYLINQTQSVTIEGYREALTERIGNLAAAHELIECAYGHSISLVDVVARTLKPYAGILEERIRMKGPNIELRPQLCLALHMIFHELATNACKHGALASASGQVEILWDQHLGGTGRQLAVQWSELNGPEVCEPKRRGFGLSLVTKALTDAQVELKFERSGLVCRILVDIDKLPA